MSKKVKRERGIFLTLIIIYIFINILKSIIDLSNFNQAYSHYFNLIPFWFLPVALLANLFEIVGVYGLIKWEKWGVYSIYISLALSLLISVLAAKHSLELIFSTLVISIILPWGIYRKWNNFI